MLLDINGHWMLVNGYSWISMDIGGCERVFMSILFVIYVTILNPTPLS